MGKRIPVAILIVTGLGLGAYWYGAGQPTEQVSVRTQEAAHSTAPTVSQTIDSQPAAAESAEKVDSVDLLLQGLIQRLEEEPEDMGGWALLGKSYHHLGRWEEAAAAFEKAKSLGYTAAPPSLDENANTRKLPRSRKSPLFAPVDTSHIFKKMPSVAAAQAETSRQVSATRLSVRVNLSPELAAKVPADANVFVFARSAMPNGSKAPLAVTRRSMDDFPIEVSLDDSMAMVEGRMISSVANVVIGARIALSGSPIGQPGDPEILSGSLSSSHKEIVELTLLDVPGGESF